MLLGGIEGLEFDNLRHDRSGEHLRGIELFDIRLGDFLLFSVLIEDN